MMPGYIEVIRVEDRNRRDLFQQAAQRMGAPPANVEKDFWVCLILDALFNWPLDGGARLLFKGGTSLAKAYGLISRFSEDIDVTVFREDLGEPGDAAALGALSRNQRERRLEAMKVACHRYIVDRLLPHLRDEVLASTFEMARRPFTPTSVTLDVDDDQTILFAYPTVVEEDDGYVRRVVKIEMGAKSALDPHDLVTIRPFIAADMGDIPFDVRGVRTIHPVRTFWDKLYIAHETRERFETRGQMQGGGQRLSRHYRSDTPDLAALAGDAKSAPTSPGFPGRGSRGCLCREFEAERFDHAEQGGQPGIAILAERLVERLACHPGTPSNLSHATRSRNHAERIGDVAGIAGLQRIAQKLGLRFRRTQVPGGIEGDRLGRHGQSSRSAARAFALLMSRACVRLSPPHSRITKTRPRCTK